VGCKLNLDDKQISFSLNGVDLGIAFDEVEATKTKRIFPCASLKGGPHVFNFTETVLYRPDDYRLFTDAVDDGKSAYAEWNEIPVRDWLALRAAQVGAAWVAADKYAKNLGDPHLMQGQPIM
jgi:hypothetical protein